METKSEIRWKPGRVDDRHDRWQERLITQPTITNFTYIVADVISIIAAGMVGALIIGESASLAVQHRPAIMIAVLLAWIVFNAGGMYRSWRGRDYVDHARAAMVGWLTVVVTLSMLEFFVDLNLRKSPDWVFWWALLALIFILSIRIATMALLRAVRERGHNHKRVLIVGGGVWGQEVIKRMRSAEWLGLDVVGVIDSHTENMGQRVAGVPYFGNYDRLLSTIEKESADEVWICLPLGSSRGGGRDWVGEITEILNDSTVTQRLLPEIEEMRLLNRPVTEIIGLPVVDLNSTPMQGVGMWTKAVGDRVLSVLILVLVSPILLMIAAAIKLESKGPIFFQQLRHGSDGKPFKMHKFRTMRLHSENGGEVTQAKHGDKRVTKVGSFLRRNSLDELPQFFNVLLGDMSIVGPRPHAVEHNQYYRKQIDSYMQRHRVRPGITGWAQVNGFRGPTENVEQMRQRVNYDLYYIDHWSLWFDIKIILRTVFHGFRGENAI